MDGRNEPGENEPVVVRGGSWYDRPMRSRSAYRLSYPDWQKVHDVGLRVVIEGGTDVRLANRDD
jgi:formylglycine-generating enzyme required for sulfatase activity